jgi:hypothetical protein
MLEVRKVWSSDEGMLRRLVTEQKNKMGTDATLSKAKREAIEFCNDGNSSGCSFTRMYECRY